MCLNHHTTFYFYFNKIVELNYTDMKYASGPMQMFPKSLIANRSQGRRLHILVVISKPTAFQSSDYKKSHAADVALIVMLK